MLIKSNEEITPVECISDMQYSYPPHVSGETFISHSNILMGVLRYKI